MSRIQIVAFSNGVGNTRDIELLQAPLQALGHEVTVTLVSRGARRRRRWGWLRPWVALRCWLARRAATTAFDLTLHLEHVWPGAVPSARRNVLVPNPEWFDRHDRRWLDLIDALWTKTRHAQELLVAFGKPLQAIGFDSVDRYLPAQQRRPTFFHLAGKSRMKGTARLLSSWARHPQWPQLAVVLSRRLQAELPTAANITYHAEFLDDAQLAALQNGAVFHLCTSETEGWGHYIPEAMSVGAVVIATDVAPMNEQVTPDRGLLIAAHARRRQHLAMTYAFDETALEAVVAQALSMDAARREALGHAARAWFLQNKQGFPARLAAALQLGTPPG